jgi:hypothetical protein
MPSQPRDPLLFSICCYGLMTVWVLSILATPFILLWSMLG